MIRLGKLTDYGLVLMSYVAKGGEQGLHTARGLAAQSKLPLPTVSKLLKVLLQSGFLVSHRGIKGGYTLAREHKRFPSPTLSLLSRDQSVSPNAPPTSLEYATWSHRVPSK